MEDKTVKIVLGKDGSVKVEASGFKGGTCEDATAFLDKIFAVDKRKHKASYYEHGDTIINSLPSGLCG
jgi:hypothetical protein